MVMQFKATPIAFIQRAVGKAVVRSAQGISPVEYGAHIGGFVAGLLIAGCMSIVAKDRSKATGRRATRKDPRTILRPCCSRALRHPRRFPVANVNRFGGGALRNRGGADVWDPWAR